MPSPASLESVPGGEGPEKASLTLLFLASFIALFFELVMIRYVSTEIRLFAYLKNLPLIASFLGIGIGMIVGRPPRALTRALPVFAGVLFLAAAYAGPLHITHIPFPSTDYFLWALELRKGRLEFLSFYGTVCAILACAVAFFAVLGGLVGQHFRAGNALRAYGVNLAGSLAGILVFMLLAWLGTPPVVWLAVGLLSALPFLFRRWAATAAFLFILTAVSFAGALVHTTKGPFQLINTYWSPYYRIDLWRRPNPPGWPRPADVWLAVNHDYHQRMVDLSPAFLSEFPDYEPNRSAFSTYELPYRLVRQPSEVLVVGAGTGNDVAAALRHGANHVDAVEIDPTILAIGRRYHPEQPYSSPLVTLHVNDARAFFKQTRKKYDLIVFGYLDSHTLITSYSSLRLDSYVYTVESFREARNLLKPEGTLALTFDALSKFIAGRLFVTLGKAFDVPPRAYYTGYEGGGIVFLEGQARQAQAPADLADISGSIQAAPPESIATDDWPFLYLAQRSIPRPLLMVLLLFIGASVVLVRSAVGLGSLSRGDNLHFFLLGLGFLLLETKAVTELALVFGSTWSVNAVVIGAFLTMSLLANALMMRYSISPAAAYIALLTATAVSTAFPYHSLNTLSHVSKLLAAGGIAGLPVFFSGLVFSRSFRASSRPTQALGVNLLGAAVGGALENSVMIWGVSVLGLLALGAYALSALALGRQAWPGRHADSGAERIRAAANRVLGKTASNRS